MKLSIIIVSWNVCEDVLRCLESIYSCPPSESYEIILVDNASADDTVPCVHERFPEVKLIENAENLGFAAANNRGLEKAAAEYVFFLNPDTIVLPDALDKLIVFMGQHPEIGLCGPQILNPDYSIQRSVRRFPTFKAIASRFTILKYLRLFREDFHRWTMRDFDHKERITADQLMGAAIMARADIIRKIKSFDERFFMYYEEVDLCYRVKKIGLEVVFFPESAIIHLGGSSAKQIPAKVKFMVLKSLVLFMHKHHGGMRVKIYLMLFKLGVFTRQFFEMVLYSFAFLFSFYWPSFGKKNYLRVKSSFLFLVKYYIRLLVTRYQ